MSPGCPPYFYPHCCDIMSLAMFTYHLTLVSLIIFCTPYILIIIILILGPILIIIIQLIIAHILPNFNFVCDHLIPIIIFNNICKGPFKYYVSAFWGRGLCQNADTLEAVEKFKQKS